MGTGDMMAHAPTTRHNGDNGLVNQRQARSAWAVTASLPQVTLPAQLLAAPPSAAAMDAVLTNALKDKQDKTARQAALYRGMHRIHWFFVAALHSDTPVSGRWHYDSFEEVCDKAIGLAPASVRRSIREVIVDTLVREVLLTPAGGMGADENDRALAEAACPSTYRSLTAIMSAWMPEADGVCWMDCPLDALVSWFKAPQRRTLRTLFWCIWRRARSIMSAEGKKHIMRPHIDRARAVEWLDSNTEHVRRPASAASAPEAVAAAETRVSWNRTTRCDGPSTTVSSGTRTTITTARATGESAGVKRLRSLVDDDGDNNTDGGDSRDAAYGNDDNGGNLQSQRQRRRTDAYTAGGAAGAGGGGMDDGAQRASLAARLQSGFAAVTTLGEPGLMLQAAARVLSLCTPEETRAWVARAYATVVPSPSTGADVYDDGEDDSNGSGIRVPGPHAPTAFVAWFALHHAAYGLENTPDYVWNTKLLPTSPREDDPWSRAYWLARAKSSPSVVVTASSDVRTHPPQ